MGLHHDRRTHPRRPVRFSVKYTVKSGTYRDLVGNVSAGGVFIITRHRIAAGQRISLQFPVFAFDYRPSVLGIVVRSQKEGLAVTFDTPFERRFCPADQRPQSGPQPDPSDTDTNR